MTILSRRIASIPKKLASETWVQIIEMLASNNQHVTQEMTKIAGIASSLITRQSMKRSPLIATGKGPRVRIYCVYGHDAIDESCLDESPLPETPLNADKWKISLPCPTDDLSWVREKLERLSTRIEVRDEADFSLIDKHESVDASMATINVESFQKP